MAKLKDLKGQRFGRLVVLERAKNNKNGDVMWRCKCDCGNIKDVSSYHLQRRTTKSCGCLKKEISGGIHKTHGLSKTILYKRFYDMITRCYNIKNKEYHNYGGRGITVCQEWLNEFKTFYNWAINNGYKKGLTIDRIDVNGNYEPDNCRWVSIKIQANNTRTNHKLTYKNQTHTITEWSEIIGINSKCLFARIKRGWSIEKALTTPIKKV